jgi:hypothetical protein
MEGLTSRALIIAAERRSGQSVLASAPVEARSRARPPNGQYRPGFETVTENLPDTRVIQTGPLQSLCDRVAQTLSRMRLASTANLTYCVKRQSQAAIIAMATLMDKA